VPTRVLGHGWEVRVPTRHQAVIVRCPDCGEQRVPLEAVVLRHCVDDDTWTYRGRCPECTLLVAGATSRRAADAATESGAEVEQWRFPRELFERPSGPKFSIADVLELRLALIEDTWIDDLQRYG
jgi:hypothetical protein